MTNEELVFSSGAMPITLVCKTNGGTLRGTVAKCASGKVVLVPAVRPGAYYALAVLKDMTLNYRKLDEELLREADTVTVNASEASSVDLR